MHIINRNNRKLLQTKDYEKKLQKGRLLLETLMALCVMGVITVGGIAGFQSRVVQHKANKTLQQIMARASAVSPRIVGDQTYNLSGFEEKTQQGYKIKAGNLGKIENFRFSLEVEDVPKNVCEKLLKLVEENKRVLDVINLANSKSFAAKDDYESICGENDKLSFSFQGDLKENTIQKTTGYSCPEGCVWGNCLANNICECDAGYKGTRCDIPICDEGLCKNGGTCSAPNACSCPKEYAGTDCSTPVCVPDCGSGTCLEPNVCQCDKGYYSTKVGEFGCASCGAGKETSVNSGANSEQECVDCEAGKYSNPLTLFQCRNCSAGSFSKGGAENCTPCPKGQYTSSLGARTCLLCPVGKYQDLEGQTGCKECPQGTVALESGQVSCGECPVGYTPSSNGKLCNVCDRGYYSVQGKTQCIPCPDGKETKNKASVGINLCVSCTAGKYSNGETEHVCESCPKGTYSSSDFSTCIPCEAGKYAQTESSVCSVCPRGTYSDKQAGSCTPCPSGYTTENEGAVSKQACIKCPAGTFTNTNNQCEKCPLGTYSEEGAGRCISCPVGYYADSVGSLGCKNCEMGYSTSSSGSTSRESCQKCSVGKYSNASTKYICSSCPEGLLVNQEATHCLSQ